MQEMHSCLTHIQLLLYPEIVYKPIAEDRTIAKEEGLEVRTKGPQAMLYVLDEYAGEVGQVENLTANIIFSGHMADAALNNRFPFKTGERSSEFQKAVKEAFEKAQRYVLALEEESRGKLLPRISKLGDLNEIALKQTARNFVLYEVEPLKTQGLIEVPLKDDINLSPADAIATGQTYLHCDERELPFINPLGDSSYTGVHAEAWSEYGRNRWDRDNHLYGRYVTQVDGDRLCLDFKLDSTHFPSPYGFFDIMEIQGPPKDGSEQHILIGQEVNRKMEPLAMSAIFAQPQRNIGEIYRELPDKLVYPVVVAGDFNFSIPSIKERLEQLAADKGTKVEIAAVLRDILTLASQDKLNRLATK